MYLQELQTKQCRVGYRIVLPGGRKRMTLAHCASFGGGCQSHAVEQATPFALKVFFCE